MNSGQLVENYKADESKCWKYTDFIKHNPVFYPRVGDIFLKELFSLANPEYDIPYSRRKKVQMDSVWYDVSEETFALFVMGCVAAKEQQTEFDITLDNGNVIPFYCYLYLTCLFIDQAKRIATKEVSGESITRLRKEKEQKGICRPDCRKYYKCIGFMPRQIASDLPIAKNFCPLEKEYECARKCPTGCMVGANRVCKGYMSYRSKEELLYLNLIQTGHLPVGAIAGELLFDYMSEEYRKYGQMLEEEFQTPAHPVQANCQMFSVLAYMVDALYASEWLLRKDRQPVGVLEETLCTNKLWQLLDLLKADAKGNSAGNMLARILYKAQKMLDNQAQ